MHFFVLNILLSGCGTKQFADTYWYSTTINDLIFVKKTLMTHSAPASNTEDHHFNTWLENGFLQASEYAKKAKNSDNHIDILQFYIRGFKLDHLSFRLINNSKLLKNWFYPGFLLQILDGHYIVGHVDSENSYSYNLKKGTEIIEIDGKPIDFYMKNVFAALYSNKYTKAEYIRLAPYLLIDKNNFLMKRPKEVTYLENKKYKKINLIWHPKEIDQLMSISHSLSFSEELSIGYKFINKGVWISLPSFDPSENEAKIFIEILRNLKKFRHYPFIIFDVRGNGGGSSDWQRPILRNLYGDSFIKSLGVNHHYNHDWIKKIRITLKNYNDLQKHMTEHEKKSFLSDLKHNRTHHLEKWNIFNEKENLFSHQDNVKKFPRIYLLTDGRCSSTCWFFVREMLQMPNVIQIGEETTHNHSIVSHEQ